MAVIHECFPHRLHLWDEASRRLEELHRFTGPSVLEHYLPDPTLFVDPSGALKPSLVRSWLRIRPVILWRLGLPSPPSFVNKKWRSMLEAADNFRIVSQDRREMLDILKGLVRESHLTLDEDALSSAPTYWNERLVDRDVLDPSIVREIVWELYEAKFRLELLTLDRHMVPEPQGDSEESEMLRERWFAREVEVHRCWPGLAHRPNTRHCGFSSHSDQPNRFRYLEGLFHLIKGWPGRKPDNLTKTFPKEDDDLRMREVEEGLANYYVRMFVKVYHRPPSIPHVL